MNKNCPLAIILVILFILMLSGCEEIGMSYDDGSSDNVDEDFFVLFGNIKNNYNDQLIDFGDYIEFEYGIESPNAIDHWTYWSPTIYLSKFENKDFYCKIKSGYPKYYFSVYCYNNTRVCFIEDHIFTNMNGKDMICQIEIDYKGEIEISTEEYPEEKNKFPLADIKTNVVNGTAPLTISFSAIVEDRDGIIKDYYWDFGDGNTSTDSNPIHTFRDAGTRFVSLKVQDNQNDIGKDEIKIKIHSQKPDIDSLGKNVAEYDGNIFPEPIYNFPEYESDLSFGISTDTQSVIEHYDSFIREMNLWNPMFIVDLGDWATECEKIVEPLIQHNCQLDRLINYYCNFASTANIPDFYVLGNHDVGWLNGEDDYSIGLQEFLYHNSRSGAYITKRELIDVTNIPHRYYAFNIKANETWYRFYVLDGNNKALNPKGHDESIIGDYSIDDQQFEHLENDLKQHSNYKKIFFCHEELYYNSSVECIDGIKNPATYIDNGWKIRELLSEDGNVIVCFHGHRHCNRHTIYGGVHYITLEDMECSFNYVKVVIKENNLCIWKRNMGAVNLETIKIN